MRKPENTFIAGVHGHLPPKAELHREKMNNPYSSGTADCWYSAIGGPDLWIEYKYLAALPVRDSTIVVPDLSKVQLEWVTGRFLERRCICVVLGTKAGGVIFKNPREWTDGLSADVCRSRLVSRQGLAKLITLHCTKGELVAPLFTVGSEVRSSTL